MHIIWISNYAVLYTVLLVNDCVQLDGFTLSYSTVTCLLYGVT